MTRNLFVISLLYKEFKNAEGVLDNLDKRVRFETYGNVNNIMLILKKYPASMAFFVLFVLTRSVIPCSPPLDDGGMLYNEMLFAGTHNSAINLGKGTPLRPSGAVGGRYPSEAHQAYGYQVMDQRLSILDQLEQGLRVLDFEVASLESSGWICNKNFFSNQSNSCKEHYTLHGRCFSNCPFIVSHGNLEESIGLGMGYTFPEKLFASVAEFVAANPLEVVTLVLLGTHGNAFPSEEAVVERLNSTGLLQFVYNFDPVTGKQVDLADNYPTLRAMRATKKTVLVVTNKGPDWHIAHSNASLISGSDTAGTCTHPKTKVQTRCLELWDSITVGNLSPNQAVLDQSNIHGLFAIPNLSSRRGRADNNTSYTRLPNIRHDFPFVAGGNPAQASAAANGSHIRQLEKRWAELLEPYGQVPNWILVDFFNTTTAGAPKESSRTLLPNTAEGEGLVRAVCDINRERIIRKETTRRL